LLPLVPAITELLWPKDTTALNVMRDHDGNVAVFANRFESFIDANFRTILAELEPKEVRVVQPSSGAAAMLFGPMAEFSDAQFDIKNSTIPQLLVGGGDLFLPDDLYFESEVFTVGDLTVGNYAGLRAILAHGAICLGLGSVVLRWVHAKGGLQVAQNVQLFGRASSDVRIELAPGCTFERLYAPQITFGAATHPATTLAMPYRDVSVWQPSNTQYFNEMRCRIKGDVSIPPASGFSVPLVVLGNLRIGSGSWFRCGVKSSQQLIVNENSRIDDALVSCGRLLIAENCVVKGPVISESSIIIRAGSVIGTSEFPTTITAPKITIEPGVIVFGTVWAREKGVATLKAKKNRQKTEEVVSVI
jgi:cytoskeletal protein CcmA (bactofilin family)